MAHATVPDRANFESPGNGRYRSADFANAANRVQLRLVLGLGECRVR